MVLRPMLKEFFVTIQDDTREHNVSLHAYNRVRVECDNSNRPALIMIKTWQF